MRTERIVVDPLSPEPAALRYAAELIKGGKLVAFPTETVYGLGAHALDPQAVQRIYDAKGRPANNPLIVHVAERAQARELARLWTSRAQRLADRFWPGPLSLVLEKQPHVPDAVTAGSPTVALRIPAHRVARKLLMAAGVPIAAPSANRSTHISPTSAEHVLAGLDGRVDLVLDAGPTPGGLESTVIDLTCDPPRLLRPGLIALAELEAALEEPIASGTMAADARRALPSPGMLARHYAPTVPVECVTDDGWQRASELAAAGERVGWLAWGLPRQSPPTETMLIWLPNNVEQYSARLYAALHAFEAAAVQRIVAALPPDEPAWLAVRDRLARASARE
ncbi:MAG TPA: L-threonylcarbamoyladenylate synthase [Pirellulales bacterium]|nr:L-threonylcarbamoyladenylate synthase [Pirellulales bacterium]